MICRRSHWCQQESHKGSWRLDPVRRPRVRMPIGLVYSPAVCQMWQMWQCNGLLHLTNHQIPDQTCQAEFWKFFLEGLRQKLHVLFSDFVEIVLRQTFFLVFGFSTKLSVRLSIKIQVSIRS